MPTNLNSLRSEVEGKLQPPIDVMLDPSLLIAEMTRSRLADSMLFDAQMQATLGQAPTQTRVDNLYVPTTFLELIETDGQTEARTTSTWNFFRGQAQGANVGDIAEMIDSHGVEAFVGDAHTDLRWETSLVAENLTERLTSTLEEIGGFLATGGVLLSRTSVSLDVLRDAGVTTLDLGRAELNSEVRDRLLDIGYQEQAPVCAFGIESTSGVARSLVGDLLATHGDLLVYRFGA